MEMLEFLRKNRRKEDGSPPALRGGSAARRVAHPGAAPARSSRTATPLPASSEIDTALAELPDVPDRKEVADRVHALLRGLPKGATGNRTAASRRAHGPRPGASRGRGLLPRNARPGRRGLRRLRSRTTRTSSTNQAKLLQQALFVAAHFERVEQIHALVARFTNAVAEQRTPEPRNALRRPGRPVFPRPAQTGHARRSGSAAGPDGRELLAGGRERCGSPRPWRPGETTSACAPCSTSPRAGSTSVASARPSRCCRPHAGAAVQQPAPAERPDAAGLRLRGRGGTGAGGDGAEAL